jgi:crotonobetainyl-CoA:carnitine CoA-transferase CaiB-like acyl-CoA transferase
VDDRAALDVTRWAESGCMALTGPAESAGLGPPTPLVAALDAVAHRLGVPDPLAIVAARAAFAGLSRRGRTSCGGSTRLLRTVEGWVALALPRDDDVALVPALVESDDVDDPWAAVARWCTTRTASDVVDRAVLLGLAVGELPQEVTCGSGALVPPGRQVEGPAVDRRRPSELVVVDLSSLWAGPLCGALLADAGLTVVKVESTSRPDGARGGPRAFFDLLNGRKLSVALDLGTRDGVDALRTLLARADVVIEASRPRALRQMQIDASSLLATGPRVWLSITGHGRAGADAHRIGFGDDTAVSAGLVVDDAGPWFCADAIADPITGMVAAASVLSALDRGGRWHYDVSMEGLARQVAGPTLDVPPWLVATAPIAPAVPCAAPALGAHTSHVLERF